MKSEETTNTEYQPGVNIQYNEIHANESQSNKKLTIIQVNVQCSYTKQCSFCCYGSFRCMVGMLQLAAVSNNNLSICAAVRGAISLNLANNIHTLNNTAEDNMLAIKPGSLDCAQEELGTIGVWSSIGHGQNARASVTQVEVLISKLLAIDGLPTCSIPISEVTTLTHEVRNHTMEGAALVAKAFLPSAQGTEVLSSLGHNISSQLQKKVSAISDLLHL